MSLALLFGLVVVAGGLAGAVCGASESLPGERRLDAAFGFWVGLVMTGMALGSVAVVV